MNTAQAGSVLALPRLGGDTESGQSRGCSLLGSQPGLMNPGRLQRGEAAAASSQELRGLPAAQRQDREALRAGEGTQEHAHGREGLLPRAQTE